MKWIISAAVSLWICAAGTAAQADLTINVLAVNATDESKEKEVRQNLPPELKAEDVLDPAGLKLDYNVDEQVYYVHDTVTLAPKETRTYKVKVKDVWRVNPMEVEGLKIQIDQALAALKNTRYYDNGVIKRQDLLDKLDRIVARQEENAQDVKKRVDRFKIYRHQLEGLRRDTLSVTYWKEEEQKKKQEDVKILDMIISVENPSDKDGRFVTLQHYLPQEVQPQHVVRDEGFEVMYDPKQSRTYLAKEEELKPGEKKRYKIGIQDVWSIPQEDIDKLKDRTRQAYDVLKDTEYLETANYLVENIRRNLREVEGSQAQVRPIKQHIQAFRENQGRYNAARDDVETMEALLLEVKKRYEQPTIKNVLKHVKPLEAIAEIAKAIFQQKPFTNNTWKVISAIIGFVGLLTLFNFIIWLRRTKEKKTEEFKREESET